MKDGRLEMCFRVFPVSGFMDFHFQILPFHFSLVTGYLLLVSDF